MSNNYAKIYEFKLNNSSNLTLNQLLTKVLFLYKRRQTVSTDDGTFYINDYQNSTNSIIFLFGKDNDDGSNYKREKSTSNIEKININVNTEVLTDFVHISINKNEDLGSYTLLLEKNNLITHHNIISFLNNLFTVAMPFSLSRRVTIDFYNEIQNASRIISLTQVKKKAVLPFMSEEEASLNYIEVKEDVQIKARRAKTIPIPIFNKLFSNISDDPKLKLVAEIVNCDGNKMLLDFDSDVSPFTVKIQIEENDKTDKIQRNIAYSLDSYLGKQNSNET